MGRNILVKDWELKQGEWKVIAFFTGLILLILAGFALAGNSTLEIASVNNSMFSLNPLDCIRFQNTSFSFTVCAANQTSVVTVTQFVNVSVPFLINQNVTIEKNVTKRFDQFIALKFGERFFDYEGNLTVEAPPKILLEKLLNPGDSVNYPDYGLSFFVKNATIGDCITIVQNNTEASKAVCPLPQGPNEEACKILFPNLTNTANSSCPAFSGVTQSDKQEIARLSSAGVWNGLFYAGLGLLIVLGVALFLRGRGLRLALGPEEIK